MNKKINEKSNAVIDANVIIAHSFPQDALHQHAIKLMRKVDGLKKYLNPLLVSEIATVLLQRTKDQVSVNQLTNDLITNQLPQVRFQPLSKKLLAQTMIIFAKQKTGNLSFADASVIAQARLENISQIITFDKDLKKEFASEFKFLPKL